MTKRRLAAILAADVVGFSKLIGEDEAGTLAALREIRRGIVNPVLAEHGGRIFKSMGDGILAEFPSAVQALRAAIDIQERMRARNAGLPEEGKQVEVRIGVHQGDVVVEGSDLLGDGVNIAARLEALAEPGGICISGRVHEDAAGKIVLKAHDMGDQPLKNIARPVRAYRVSLGSSPTTQAAAYDSKPALPLPDKPSIAVLPFQNMSGDPEQEYFADGMVEEIITALSRFRQLFVIARNSTFTYKGKAVDVKQVGRELGVRYVLEGSVRRSGQRVRITGQLVEAQSGTHLWAARFDRDMTDIFAVQDEITERVVGAIEPEILLVEGKRASRKSIGNLDAFDCYMRAMWHFSQVTPESQDQAIALLREAIKLDPGLAQPHMALARALDARIWHGGSSDLSRDASDAHAAATRSVGLDVRDPYCHYALSWTSLVMRMQTQALQEAQHSIDLTPNFALGFYALGAARVYLGHFKEALDALRHCLRLNPNDPQAGAIVSFVALAHYHQKNYEEAAHHTEHEVRGRRYYNVLRVRLASLGQLGRVEDAQPLIRDLLSRRTDAQQLFDITSPYLEVRHRDHLAEGLQRAGLTSLR